MKPYVQPENFNNFLMQSKLLLGSLWQWGETVAIYNQMIVQSLLSAKHFYVFIFMTVFNNKNRTGTYKWL